MTNERPAVIAQFGRALMMAIVAPSGALVPRSSGGDYLHALEFGVVGKNLTSLGHYI
jgi:hypothetical protein